MNTVPRRTWGFTIVELLIAVVVVAVLAVVSIFAYQGVQHRAVESVAKSTISEALKSLKLFHAKTQYYPSNFADTTYAPPTIIGVAFYTNAAQQPVYSGLNSDQNAQLFLNSCNGFMPIESGSTTYNTACVYSGNNLHASGQNSSNIVIQGPFVNQSDFVLTCGSICTTTRNQIIATFFAQGGSFPIQVPKKSATLPAPQLVTTGNATDFCVEARSSQFQDIVYHGLPASASPVAGPCPTNPSLHYP